MTVTLGSRVRRVAGRWARHLWARECREMAPQLSSFVEGMLSGPAAAAVAAHLLACRGCRRAHDLVVSGVARARLLRPALASVALSPGAGPPSWDELLPRLDQAVGRQKAAAVSAEATAPSRTLRWSFAAAAAAALLLTAARGRGTYDRAQSPPEEPGPRWATAGARIERPAPRAVALPPIEGTCLRCHDPVRLWSITAL